MTTETPIDFSLRPAWVDRWLETLSLEIDNDTADCGSVVVFPDHDTKIRLQWDLSEDEFTKLLSCVLFGSAILFPEISERGNIIWSLLKAVDCMPDICDEVENCIETSEGVQNALDSFVASSDAIHDTIDGYITSRGLTYVPEQNTAILENMLDSGCVPDVVFGQVTAVWNIINQTTIDFLEILSAAGNIAESVSMVISAIPIIGQLPADEIIDFVGKFGEWTLDAYNAFLTTGIENQIKCDLFCLAIEDEDCILTTENLLNYFATQAGILSDVKVNTIEEFIQFITDLPNDVALSFICGMATAQLFIVSLLEKFLGFSTIQAYIAFARLGDPSDDWEGLCEDCPVFWSWNSNFPASANIWEPRNSTGVDEAVYVASQGFNQVSINATSGYWRIDAIEATFEPVEVDEISMIYNLTKGAFNNTAQPAVGIFAYSGGPTGTLVASNSRSFASSSSGTGLNISLSVNDTIDYIFALVRSSNQLTASYSGLAKITSFAINGEGDSPFD